MKTSELFTSRIVPPLAPEPLDQDRELTTRELAVIVLALRDQSISDVPEAASHGEIWMPERPLPLRNVGAFMLAHVNELDWESLSKALAIVVAGYEATV